MEERKISRKTLQRVRLWATLMTQLIDLEEDIINDIPRGQAISTDKAIATFFGCSLIPEKRRKKK